LLGIIFEYYYRKVSGRKLNKAGNQQGGKSIKVILNTQPGAAEVLVIKSSSAVLFSLRKDDYERFFKQFSNQGKILVVLRQRQMVYGAKHWH
jgi:hypothetical protein